MTPDRLIVVAGDAAQCRYFCVENQLNPHLDVVYASSAQALRGLPHGSRFVCVGTYSKRRDLRDLFSCLDQLGAVRVLPEQRGHPDAWMLPEPVSAQAADSEPNLGEELGDILAPFHDPRFAEIFANQAREVGAMMRQLGASAAAVLDRLRQEPSPFRIYNAAAEPVRVGCGCLCAVEHEGLGVCTSVAVQELKVLSDSGVTRQWVAVCRPCFSARSGQ